MADVIPFADVDGRYGKIIRSAASAAIGRSHDNLQASVIARLLDVLIIVGSEHTLSLVVRSLRDRPVTRTGAFQYGRPSEDAVHAAAAALIQRNDEGDEAASLVLSLLANLISEAELERMLIAIDGRAARRKAA